jgi:hypothetical protein
MSFAEWILEHLRQSATSITLDPWNGSGTTTSAAAKLGLAARGIDLNPAMVVIAQSRLIDPLDVPSIKPLAAEIMVSALQLRDGDAFTDEPLSYFLHETSSRTFRAIERAIARLLVDSAPSPGTFVVPTGITPIAAFFYVALFRTFRRVLAQFFGTNPVWTKLRIATPTRSRPTSRQVVAAFNREVLRMIASEAIGRPTLRSLSPKITVTLGSSTQIPVGDETVGLVFGSPPYCTRVDYAVATLPELSLLGLNREAFDQLRRSLLGTTTVPREMPSREPEWGGTCTQFLESVARHSSKASATYYLKSYLVYFQQLAKSMNEIERVMRHGAKAVLVVQDSYYKELHTDLAQIVVEMATCCGVSLESRRDFGVTRTIAVTNPATKKYRDVRHMAMESVLVFSK